MIIKSFDEVIENPDFVDVLPYFLNLIGYLGACKRNNSIMKVSDVIGNPEHEKTYELKDFTLIQHDNFYTLQLDLFNEESGAKQMLFPYIMLKTVDEKPMSQGWFKVWFTCYNKTFENTLHEYGYVYDFEKMSFEDKKPVFRSPKDRIECRYGAIPYYDEFIRDIKDATLVTHRMIINTNKEEQEVKPQS